MHDLLDEPLAPPSKAFHIPIIIKVVGFLLLFFWAGLLFLEESLAYWLQFYNLFVDVPLLITIYLLFARASSYEHKFLQQRAKVYHKWLPIPLLGIMLCYFAPSSTTAILQQALRIGLFCLLSHFIISLYEAQPRAASIWLWLKMSVIAWMLTIFVLILLLHLDRSWGYEIYDMIHPLFFILSMLYTALFYKQLSFYPPELQNVTWNNVFIGCAHLVILGHIIKYFLEFGLGLTMLGIGGMGLLGLYAWVVSTKT